MLWVCTRCDAKVAAKVLQHAHENSVPACEVECLGICDEGPACCVDFESETREPLWIGRLHKKKRRHALYEWMQNANRDSVAMQSDIDAPRKAYKRLAVLQSRRT